MSHNVTSAVGIIGGLILLALAIAVTASDVTIFISPPSFIIVCGGTLAATIVTYSFPELFRALRRAGRLLLPELAFRKQDIDHLVDVATIVQKSNVKLLEKEIEKANSPFVKTGLRMLSDGMPEAAIVGILENRMHQMEETERGVATLFRTMAGYSPAFGMAGTLIGLVNMLLIMGSGGDPRLIGVNMATALLTTFYGIVLANAILKPIAGKIEKKCVERMHLMGAILEAFRAIAQRKTPSYVREILYAIAINHDEELGLRDTLVSLTEGDLYGKQ